MTENFKSYAVKILTEALTEVSTSIKNQAEERIFSPISRTSSSETYNPQDHSQSNLDTLVNENEINHESEENKKLFIFDTNSYSNPATSPRSFDKKPDTVEAVQTEKATPDEHQINVTNESNTVSVTITTETGNEYKESNSSVEADKKGKSSETIDAANEKIDITRTNSHEIPLKRLDSSTASTGTLSAPNELFNSSAIGTGIDQINSEDDNIAAEVTADLITNVINTITEEEKEVADLSLITPSIIETVEDHIKAEIQKHPGTSAADGTEENLTLSKGLEESDELQSESLESADSVKLESSSKVELKEIDLMNVEQRE